jgi:hypothetical protein
MFAALDKVSVKRQIQSNPMSGFLPESQIKHDTGTETRTFTSSIFLKNTTASGQKARTKRQRLILDSRT